jgi:spermidine synthase
VRWIEFDLGPGERAAHQVERVIHEGQTTYQHVVIADTVAFGRALFLDGAPQSAQRDEHLYHEALVHPALVSHPNPRRVLICGGGEGATLREVLRHPSVERAVMVDIDGELVELCRQHLGCMHQGSFDDPRADVVVDDAVAWAERSTEQFDAIIGDLVDPSEPGAGELLYGDRFFGLLRDRLAPGGILATQAYAFALNSIQWAHGIIERLDRLFGIVRLYRTEVPFFRDSWAICTASDRCDPRAFGESTVDAILATRNLAGLRHYDGATHAGMFALSPFARTNR